MADPRAFLSFDFDNDATSRTLFVGQAKSDSPTPFTLEDWSSKRSLPEKEWEALIASKISSCHLMIVLVGTHMGSAYGVASEIAMANDKNVPYFGVYVNGAGSSSVLPTGLSRGRVIPWTWDGVASAVNQMMGEGKNA